MRKETGGRVCYPEAKYYCDHCKAEIKSILDVVKIRGPTSTWDLPEFCSVKCLKDWASGKQSKPEVKVAKRGFWDRLMDHYPFNGV